MITFVIPGEPKAKARPRTTRTRHTYTPPDTVNYENWVKLCYQNSENNFMYENEPLIAEIAAFFTIANSKSKKDKKAMEAGRIKPTKKPDADNIAKIVLDSLNGLAYKDDSQVVILNVAKFYSNMPRVEVNIYSVEEAQDNE